MKTLRDSAILINEHSLQHLPNELNERLRGACTSHSMHVCLPVTAHCLQLTDVNVIVKVKRSIQHNLLSLWMLHTMQEVNNVQSGAEGDRGNDQVDNEM